VSSYCVHNKRLQAGTTLFVKVLQHFASHSGVPEAAKVCGRAEKRLVAIGQRPVELPDLVGHLAKVFYVHSNPCIKRSPSRGPRATVTPADP
jgi:hypothetical protein